MKSKVLGIVLLAIAIAIWVLINNVQAEPGETEFNPYLKYDCTFFPVLSAYKVIDNPDLPGIWPPGATPEAPCQREENPPPYPTATDDVRINNTPTEIPTETPTSTPPPDDDDDDKKIIICHHPTDSPDSWITIEIAKEAWPAHKAHGDTLGACND
jgi:hypothetical protein